MKKDIVNKYYRHLRQDFAELEIKEFMEVYTKYKKSNTQLLF